MADEDEVAWPRFTGECARMVVLGLESGRLLPMRVRCNRWGCERCARDRIREITDHLRFVSGGGDLFAVAVEDGKPYEAVRSAIMRRRNSEPVEYLSMKLHPHPVKRLPARVLVVSHVLLTGRRWAMEPVTVKHVRAVLRRNPVRLTNWSDDWHPAPTPTKYVIRTRLTFNSKQYRRWKEKTGMTDLGEIPGLYGEDALDRAIEVHKILNEEPVDVRVTPRRRKP